MSLRRSIAGAARQLAGARARVLIGLAVSTLFVVLFLRDTDFGAVADAFTNADVPLILLGLMAYFAGIWMRAVRWHYLFRPVQAISPAHLFPVVAVGYATNNVLPARTGEVVRAHVFGRRFGVSQMAGLGSVAMERLFDGLMLTVFLSVGVAASLVELGGMDYAGDVLLATLAFLVFGVSVAFWLSYRIATHPEPAARRVRRLLERTPYLRDRDHGWVNAFVEGMAAIRSRPLFLAAMWASVIAWGFESLMYFLVGEGFGLSQPFPVYLLIAAAANIIITAPSTNGGVGPFEWAVKSVLLIFLTAEGAEEVAIAYAAALHGLVLVPITLVGLAFLWIYHVPVGRLAHDRMIPAPERETGLERSLR